MKAATYSANTNYTVWDLKQAFANDWLQVSLHTDSKHYTEVRPSMDTVNHNKDCYSYHQHYHIGEILCTMSERLLLGNTLSILQNSTRITAYEWKVYTWQYFVKFTEYKQKYSLVYWTLIRWKLDSLCLNHIIQWLTHKGGGDIPPSMR